MLNFNKRRIKKFKKEQRSNVFVNKKITSRCKEVRNFQSGKVDFRSKRQLIKIDKTFIK